jgi:hypothetical protein
MEPLETRRFLSVAAQPTDAAHPMGCNCMGCMPEPMAALIDEPWDFDDATADYWNDVPPPADPLAEQIRAMAIAESTPLVPVGQQPVGALTGRVVYANAGHGFKWTGSAWTTDRPLLHNMVEDFGNHDQLNFYVDYLWRAGATVVPLRPVGYQTNELIVDNTSLAAGDWVGAWSNSSSSIYYGNAGDAVPYRFAAASTTETAVARYRANIPAGGFYPVYAWAQHGGNRVPDQLYRVYHSGGATEVKVNHQMVGNGWVYLGTYHFNAGPGGPGLSTGGYVEISNRSSGGGSVVIADAIRFGNGIGPSGHGRHDEASLYWVEAARGQGVPSSAHGTSTVTAQIRFAEHMNREQAGHMTDRVFLSFHSNASGGRGSIGLWNDPALFPGTNTPNQLEWARLVGKEVNDDLVAIGAPPLEHAWHNRGNNVTFRRTDFAFGEINNTWAKNEFDATILEVAFHDNQLDAELMRDPKARDWVARATYQATLRYFNQFAPSGSKPPVVFLPDPATNVRAVANNGTVTLNWAVPVVDGIGGQAATGYRIYVSTNGYGFDGGTFVAGGSTTQYTFQNLPPGSDVYYFKIAAVNAGGEAAGSPVVAARPLPAGKSQVLIVNGFDRLERQQNPVQRARITGGSLVSFERVRPRLSNSFDYAIQAAEAIKAFDSRIGIDSVQNFAIRNGQVNLNDYHTIIWLSGEQSTRHSTFTSIEQTAVTNFLNAGGKFFVSGSEIGWDLDAQNNGRTFYRNVLRAQYLADDAGGYTAAGTVGGIFQTVNLVFDNGTQFYDVDFPDRIGAMNGSTIAMSYTGSGSGGAAVVYAHPTTNQRLVNLGFPFETITTAGNRNLVMARVLDFFKTAPPSAPANIAAAPGEEVIQLSWQANSEFDVIGYNIYRSTSAGGGFVRINAAPVTSPAYADDSVIPGVTYYYHVRAVDDWGQESGDSAVVSGTAVEAQPPEVIMASFNRSSAPHAINVLFNMDVSASLVVEDLELVNLTTGQTISPAVMSLSYTGGSNVATWTMNGLPNGVLPDGNYQARLVASGITSPGGREMDADHVFHFHYLAGDATGDGRVDIADLGILAGNWQQNVYGPANGDFNYDGIVNIADLGILSGNWQVDLTAESTAQPIAIADEGMTEPETADVPASVAPSTGPVAEVVPAEKKSKTLPAPPQWPARIDALFSSVPVNASPLLGTMGASGVLEDLLESSGEELVAPGGRGRGRT